jgi:CheY-like chemotaxis protein/signal transduction histidine kinase
VISKDEIGDLSEAFNRMANSLKKADVELKDKQAEIEIENWIKTGQSELNDLIRGEKSQAELAQAIITFLAKYLDSQTGAVYLLNGKQNLELTAGYAFSSNTEKFQQIQPGQGFIGQCALEGKPQLLSNISDEYMSVDVGTTSLVPRNFVATPFLFDEKVKGVLFLGALQPFTDIQNRFLEQVLEGIGIAFFSAQSRLWLQELLAETQRQSEELQTQQEELRASNEELEEQTQALKESEANLKAQQEELRQTNEELQTQQEELRQANEELEEKTENLEQKQVEVEKRNGELKTARLELEEKAKDLEISSKYKSEFLANMSHELRTPLNSLLIFAQLLSENKSGNLSQKQVKFASDIHSSGEELLHLINDILDLSKIEAGKIDLMPEAVSIGDIQQYVQHSFQPVVEKKHISLSVKSEGDLPLTIQTDRQKLYQILKNLVSNAIKFTEHGGIDVRICPPADVPESPRQFHSEQFIAISVSDTGIGIPPDKQKLIFEAFQQADGSTSRQYGGTGLGLSISRELAKLLGAGISLKSREGEGSTFTLYFPLILTEESLSSPPEISLSKNEIVPPEIKKEPVTQPTLPATSPPLATNPPPAEQFALYAIKDDRESIQPEDKSILIVDDDPKFARILLDHGREKGFKCLVTYDGETGIKLATEFMPSAIILDINLPKMDGWSVMEQLKSNPQTRAIPVHFMSVLDKKMVGLKMGAIGFLTKPVSLDKLGMAFDKIDHTIAKTIKQLLIVEDDEKSRNSLSALLEDIKDIKIHFAETAKDALKTLSSHAIDVIILDLRLPDMTGFELLAKLESESSSVIPPVIVHTGKEISEKEETELRRHAESIILKGVNSSDRLLDEVSLFLHRVDSGLPAEKQNTFRMVHDKEELLKDRKILLVDDDMRNVYALMAVLEEKGMKVEVASNGQEALDCLEAESEIDLVLMDIMMPVMDGYEATRKIRLCEKWAKLPVIALTAKAMKGDREKCLAVGANDYLTKPIDTEKLFSLLRVWLYR